MKWTFIVQQKVKVAVLMGSVMLLIALTNLMEQKNLESMSKSFSSIYYDRLIPATDIFYLTEHLYSKRLLMENLLYSANSTTKEEVKNSLAGHNQEISSLVNKFSQTYLVELESKTLEEFRMEIEDYNNIENKIIALYESKSRQDAIALYESEGKPNLLKNLANLKDLTRIQSTVGLELIKDSRGVISSSNILMSLQIIITIIIGMCAQALVMASRMTNRTSSNVNLN